MTGVISLRNRQRVRALRLPLLRRVACHLVEAEFGLCDFELGFHFVDAPEMAAMNERFLGHEGSTDVITFDHGGSADRLHGEIFISVPDTVKQARLFRTTWPSEIVRYLIHGLLHLRGYDDSHPGRRREMKREENRLVKVIESRFRVAELARRRKFETRKSKLET